MTAIRFNWLDALRGVASIAVLVFHYHHFYLTDYSTRDAIPSIELFPYAQFLSLIYEYGKYAVQLFWVISGFVFFHSYLTKYTTAKVFLVQRFARLYPLHFASLIIIAGLQLINYRLNGHWQIYGNNDIYHFVLQLFFASNSLTISHGLSFNGPIWSVSLEIFTYFVFFFSLPFLRKHTFKVSFLLLSLFVYLGFLYDGTVWKFSQNVFVCAAYFFVGGITYLVYQFTINALVKFTLVNLLLVLLIMFSLYNNFFEITVMLLSSLIILLVSFLDYKFPVRFYFLESLGNSSYSLYLVHVPIQISILTVADLYFGGSRAFADSLITLPLYFFVSIVIAHIVFIFYEKPIGYWLRKHLI